MTRFDIVRSISIALDAGEELATSLKRKRRALNDKHVQMPLRLRFRLVK